LRASRISPLRTALALLLGALLALVSLTPAGAKPVPVKPLAEVEIGRTAVGAAPNGLRAILVPVRYPIQLAGRLVETRIALLGPGGKTIRTWVLHERLNGGRIRWPDRRRGFTFVHRLGLNGDLSRRVRRGVSVQVAAIGRLDLDEDGRAELRSRDQTVQRPTFGPRGNGGICSDIPHLRVQPDKRISVPVPVCDTRMKWRVLHGRDYGFARIRNGRLVYRAPKRFRGREYLQLDGKRLSPEAGASGVRYPELGYVQVTVGAAGDVVVRALGDSVTAGFGFYDDGSSMTIGHLLECRPGTKEFNDACSSNSLNRVSREEKAEYAPDFGLSNNVSWAAQWANSHGVTNYKNYAISGSEPADWAPGGEFHSTTERIESEDPDYVLLTMGANPLLSEMLFGVDNMGCAVEADVLGGYRECIERAFAEVHLRDHLQSLYADLVQNTEATIFLMQYHLSVPSTALAYSAAQIAMMGKLLNREIASVAADVNPQRLQVVVPPHFNVGIDISPVFPSRYTCSRLGFKVDGPSVQSNPTQEELWLLHPLSFCSGSESFEPPWVIGGDTGIHPSAAGYRQMASRVPAPS
jgi:lysophospholipase L1-like esterase